MVAPLPLLSAQLDTPDASLVLPPEPPAQVGPAKQRDRLSRGHSCAEVGQRSNPSLQTVTSAEWISVEPAGQS